MKILTAALMAESNQFCPKICELDGFILQFGEEMLDALGNRDIFENNGYELIPTVYANGSCQGFISYESYQYIESKILGPLEEHLDEIDGIYLFFHGASHFLGLPDGSGEHELLRQIRAITGPYMPIAVAADPHGNVSAEYASMVNIIRSYRECPHTDANDTYRIVAQMLVDYLKDRRVVHPAYARVPILVGGERCVSFEQPLMDINAKMNEIEKDPRLLSISYHIGFAWADSPLCCAGVMAVPSAPEYADYAQEKADEVAAYALSRRHDFHFTGTALEPHEALMWAFDKIDSGETKGLPVFISDSGDNTTAGAQGSSTFVLRQLLQEDLKDKKILLCSIHDGRTLKKLLGTRDGDHVSISIGSGIDADAEPVPVEATVVSRGSLIERHDEENHTMRGKCVTVHIDGTGIDVAVANHFESFVHQVQFEVANVDWKSYDCIYIKQGYTFPNLKEIGGAYLMALTPGATDLVTEKLPYKLIYRPMYPVDEF